MKLIITLFILAGILQNNFAQDAKLEISGTYQGQNLYFQNPFNNSGTGFCTTKVLVNNQVTNDSIHSSAYEVDLGVYGFKIGDTVNIQIFHKPDCAPKLLSNYHITRNRIEFSDLSIDQDGVFHWKAKNEIAKLPYIIEVFKWNHWVKLGEVEGKGSQVSGVGSTIVHEYQFKVLPHSGENKIRVKQELNVSNAITWNSGLEEVNIFEITAEKKIKFTSVTAYEIFDEYGNICKRDRSMNIDCSSLDFGAYYLHYDNKEQKIKFEKPKKVKSPK